jgi:hypothetical protein
MTPELLIVVDTEEEFDWRAPFSRAAIATRSIPAQARAHEIYNRFEIVPTYVVGYPVAADPVAVAFLRELKEEGKAEIGAHLHPWVTPPYAEEVNARNSYHCNLPPDLEQAKIAALTEKVGAAFGERPVIFKAGRYGFGSETGRMLADLGYRIDCSKMPYTDLRPDGGPDHRGTPPDPHWLPEGLLEVPLSVGFIGAAAAAGPRLGGLFDAPAAERLRLPGLLSRSGLVARSRLTPEGVSADEQCRLLEALARRGRRVFTLAYHSPSLEPGHTPYVRDVAGLAQFLARIETVLTFFRDELGGRFTTLNRVYEAQAGEAEAA